MLMDNPRGRPVTMGRGRLIPRQRIPAIATLLHGCSGVTILEAIIALSLLAIAVVSAAGLMMVAASQGAANRRAVEAATLAQDELDGVRDLHVATMDSSVRSVTVGSDTFAIIRTVTAIDRPPDLKRVHVTITWGTGQHYDAETVFGNLDP
jgi:Tfp pilus assembly protein PilV